jgi:hypothetical protein
MHISLQINKEVFTVVICTAIKMDEGLMKSEQKKTLRDNSKINQSDN